MKENKKTFEDKMNYLNDLANKLQDSSLPFEEAMNIYQEAKKITLELQNELDNALSKVSIVNEDNTEQEF